MGGPAAGHSHFLTGMCSLLTPPSVTLLRLRVLVAAVSKRQVGISSLTWDCYPVTKYMRYFVRHIEGIELTGISGTFFIGKNQNL